MGLLSLDEVGTQSSSLGIALTEQLLCFEIFFIVVASQQEREFCLSSGFFFSSCQQQLPVTGVPITRQRFDQMRSMFEEYVKNRTLQNWKFWIVSFLMSVM